MHKGLIFVAILYICMVMMSIRRVPEKPAVERNHLGRLPLKHERSISLESKAPPDAKSEENRPEPEPLPIVDKKLPTKPFRGNTKQQLWKTGYKANVLLHCQKDGEKFDKTIRELVPTTDKLFVVGNGPSSRNIETYLDDYDKVVRFNLAPLGVHGVGTRTDIHVVNQHAVDFHGPLVIFMECYRRRRDISALSKPGQTFCMVDKIDELCKRDPSRGFLFLSIARTASTVVSGFDEVRSDRSNHYYNKPKNMYHGMNAEHAMIRNGPWPVKKYSKIPRPSKSDPQPFPKREIPKIIHQYWNGNFPPKPLMERCRNLHPDWEYRLWSPKNVDDIPNFYNKKIFDSFGRRKSWVGQSDVLRYEVLNAFGGIYMDADTLCFRSFNPLRTNGFFAGYHNFGNPSLSYSDDTMIANGIMGSVKGHPLALQLVKGLKNDPKYSIGPEWKNVGPKYATGIIENCKHCNATGDVHILPHWAFVPYHFREKHTIQKYITRLEELPRVKKYHSYSMNLWGSTSKMWKQLSKLKVGIPEIEESNSNVGKLTCAFVANNPKFPTNVSNEIDSHDIVMRYNNYWSKNFWPNAKNIWGQKVTHVIMNDMKSRGRFIPAEVKDTTCWIRREDWLGVSMFNPKIHQSLSDVKQDLKEFGCQRITKEIFDEASSWIRKYEKSKIWSRLNSPISPTTGFFGVVLLKEKCSKMDFYGFSGNPGTWANHRYATEHDIIQNHLDFPSTIQNHNTKKISNNAQKDGKYIYVTPELDGLTCPCTGSVIKDPKKAFVRKHKDCRNNNILCSASIYECPDSKLMFTYPIPTKSELAELYKNSYSGQAPLKNGHIRVVTQSNFIKKYSTGEIRNKTIVELGCAGGHLLDQFRGHENRLICFEGDPDLHSRFKKNFKGYEFATLMPTLFDGDSLQESSVDLIMSSHVVEHISEPCVFLREAYDALKPGGLMFHEIPQQRRNGGDYPLTRKQLGEYHMTFWTYESVDKIFKMCGFEKVKLQVFSDYRKVDRTNQAKWIRALYRKPLQPKM